MAVCLSVFLLLLSGMKRPFAILYYPTCSVRLYSILHIMSKQEKSLGQVIELKCASSFPLKVCMKEVKCSKLRDIVINVHISVFM